MSEILTHPATKLIYWVVFAVLFYNSGQSFTVWLLEPESFKGGLDWLWVGMFPLLLPAFFFVNKHCGCASGQCGGGKCDIQ